MTQFVNFTQFLAHVSNQFRKALQKVLFDSKQGGFSLFQFGPYYRPSSMSSVRSARKNAGSQYLRASSRNTSHSLLSQASFSAIEHNVPQNNASNGHVMAVPKIEIRPAEDLMLEEMENKKNKTNTKTKKKKNSLLGKVSDVSTYVIVYACLVFFYQLQFVYTIVILLSDLQPYRIVTACVKASSLFNTYIGCCKVPA